MIIFAVFAMVGVGFFAMQRSDTTSAVGNVSIWGTIDDRVMTELIANVLDADTANTVSYKYFTKDNFDAELVEAIAEGRGPDIILLPHENILRHRAKIVTIPFETMPERSFIDSFADGSSIFRMNDGYIGFPFYVDPIVMYWNKSIFINEGILKPPTYWDE